MGHQLDDTEDSYDGKENERNGDAQEFSANCLSLVLVHCGAAAPRNGRVITAPNKLVPSRRRAMTSLVSYANANLSTG